MISVIQLGTLDYRTALRLQNKLVDLRKEGRVSDVLLLLEHSPVITLGRNAKAANILAAPELLAERGVEVIHCDRGGDVTFHGPGQIVGYPIFDLRAFPSNNTGRKTLGAIEYVRRLEEILIRTCADFRIGSERIPGLTGVWTVPATEAWETSIPDHQTEPQPHPHMKDQAKIAAIGVHISRTVTSHGFALNVNTDLSFFDLIVPCGITSRPVTSMERELARPLPLEDVTHSIARNFGSVFQSQVLWLESLELLLDEKFGVPARPPEPLRKLHHEDETYWA